MPNTIKKPQLVYWYKGRVFITYKRKYNRWNNKYFNDQPWHQWEEWNVVIGHEPGAGLFHIEDLYYDGMTYKSITLFGLTLGLHYAYDSEPT